MSKIYKVGGSVRDEILKRPIHDNDYVVVGSSIEEMLSLGYKQVGKDFPVFLHPITHEEYALARIEVATGKGHKDFKFEFGSKVTLEMDLCRRDFSINALAKDIETGQIIDYFNGLQDINNRVLKHVSSHFIEDPLRILRLARFVSQLEFSVHPDTIKLCKQMVKHGALDNLTPERIWKEIEKALHTFNFYLFIQTLDELDALKIIFPELYALKEVPENTTYHPEGNAYKHVLLTLQQVHKQTAPQYLIHQLSSDVQHRIALINFGLLCHDLGKSLTDKQKWPSHHGHDELGIDLVDKMCDRLKIPNEYRDFGKLACKYHMMFYEFLKCQKKTQYDKIKAITNFKDNRPMLFLYRIHRCDLMGREGKISQQRINNMYNTFGHINTIFEIMKNKTLKDLPKKTQNELSKYSGEKFGELYRAAMISYMKHQLNFNLK